MLNKSFHKSSLVVYFKTNNISITNKSKGYFHVDGEGFEAPETISFVNHPKSLLLLQKK